MDLGELLLASRKDSAVASDTGAAANLVSFKWSAQQNRILERYGIPRAHTYFSRTRFRFGDGRLGDVRPAADIPVWIGSYKGARTAFAQDAGIPALFRKSAMC